MKSTASMLHACSDAAGETRLGSWCILHFLVLGRSRLILGSAQEYHNRHLRTHARVQLVGRPLVERAIRSGR